MSPVFCYSLNIMIDWLLTYAIHSTVLLGLAWLAGCVLGGRRVALEELLWRSAFLGAMLTTTVQLAVISRPLAGTIHLQQPARATAPVAEYETALSPSAASAQTHAEEMSAGVADMTLPALPVPQPAWPLFVTLLWTAGAGLGLSRLALSLLRLRRLLAERRPFPAGRLVKALTRRMGIVRPVKLSTSQSIKVPFAVGFRKPEICLPHEFVSTLPPAQMEGLVAHEIAHIARRDPMWLVVYRLVEKLLFFQPLNRLARRRLEDAAEVLADDRAVVCTGNRHDLARCLVDVAQYSVGAPTDLAVAAALARPSTLRQRVERLLQPGTDRSSGTTWMIPILAMLLIFVAVAAPGVSSSKTPDPQDPASALTWSIADSEPATPEPTAPPEAAEPADPASPAARPASPAPASQPEPEAAPEPSTEPAPPAPPEWMAELEEEEELEGYIRSIERRLAATQRNLDVLHDRSETSAEEIERQVKESMERDVQRELAFREQERAEQHRQEALVDMQERLEARRRAEEAELAAERAKLTAEEQRAQAEQGRLREAEAQARAEERAAAARERALQHEEYRRREAEFRAQSRAEQRQALLMAKERELLELQEKLERLRELMEQRLREVQAEQ